MVLPPAPAPVSAVPRMGVHWLEIASPELQDPVSPDHHAFTYTFIHGSWNGKFIFDEPMITRAFLLTQPDLTLPLSQPAQFTRPGYYPTNYRIQIRRGGAGIPHCAGQSGAAAVRRDGTTQRVTRDDAW